MKTKLTPDRLTLVSNNMCLNDEETISDNLYSLAEQQSREFGISIKQAMYSKGRYKKTIKLPLSADKSPLDLKRGEPYLFVQVAPYDNRYAFMRLQFNGMHHMLSKPEKIAMTLEKSIFKGTNIVGELLDNLLVTEFHVAFDTPEKLSELWLDRQRSQVTMVVFNRNGELQTIYQGDKHASPRVVAYNKRAEILSRPNLGVEPEDEFLTRIEWRFRFKRKSEQPLLNALVRELEMLKEIKKLSIYNASAIKSSGVLSKEVISFIDHIGMKTIMQATDKLTRRLLRKRLKSFKRKHLSNHGAEKCIKNLEKTLMSLFRNPRNKQP